MSNILEEQFLHAVTSNDKDLVEKLMGNPNLDINYNNNDDYRKCALEIAIYNDATQIIELLVNSPAIIINNNIISTALSYFEKNNSFTLKLLLDKNKIIDINYMQNDTSLLMHVIHCTDITVVQKVIDKKADVNFRNSKGQTALMLVKQISLKDKSEICKLLLDSNAAVDIKDYNNTSLIDYINVSWNHEEILLVTEKLNINPLMREIIKFNKDEILLLIKEKKYINIPDSRNETAIFYYIRYYRYYDTDILDALLESKTIDLTVHNCDNVNILNLLIMKKNSSWTINLEKITQKLIRNELYNKNLKILSFLNLYFPKDLVNNIIYDYFK